MIYQPCLPSLPQRDFWSDRGTDELPLLFYLCCCEFSVNLCRLPMGIDERVDSLALRWPLAHSILPVARSYPATGSSVSAQRQSSLGLAGAIFPIICSHNVPFVLLAQACCGLAGLALTPGCMASGPDQRQWLLFAAIPLRRRSQPGSSIGFEEVKPLLLGAARTVYRQVN